MKKVIFLSLLMIPLQSLAVDCDFLNMRQFLYVNFSIYNCEEATAEQLKAVNYLRIFGRNHEKTPMIFNAETFSKTFSGLENVQSIIISETGDITFEAGAFQGFSKLKRLSLHDVTIPSMHKDIFSGVEGLEEISIDYIRIEEFPNEWLENQAQLNEIKINNTRIGSQFKDWAVQNSIKTLEFSSLYIEEVPAHAFKNYPELETLKMSGRSFHEDALIGLSKVKKLDLGYSGLSSLPDKIFEPTPNVLWLSLRYNRFREIPVEAISLLTQLVTLNMNGNMITQIPSDAFPTQPDLAAVYLSSQYGRDEKIGPLVIEENAFRGMSDQEPRPRAIDLDVDDNGVESVSRSFIGLGPDSRIHGVKEVHR